MRAVPAHAASAEDEAVNAPHDAMDVQLDGIRAVEASAGTGKTFTIATLYLRLILERGLAVDEIVVATFTRAAAAELSERLRQRLVLANSLLSGDDPGAAREGEDGERGETRKVIANALQAAAFDELRRRARTAQLAIDTAYIGTLHGFCHRVLAEFGFETGQALAQPDLVDDLQALQAEIVRDFWRRGSADATTAMLLADTWGAPETLATQVCDPRWRGRTIELAEPDLDALRSQFERARKQVAAWDAGVTDLFERELARCVTTLRTCGQRTEAMQHTLRWARSGSPEQALAAFDAKLTATLLAGAIEKLVPKDLRPAGQPFDDLEVLCAAYAQLQHAETSMKQLPAARMLRDARAFLELELPKRLAQRNLMGHDQAVDRLADALTDGPRGELAATRIRQRWKAALVDEFQDTDPQQWRVVQALFGPTTLVLVGDPKQAIYGFRGGDVYAWLEARSQAQGEPLRLAESWRAGAGLCAATNALFSRPGAFIEAGIAHPDIHSADAVRRRALLRDGKEFALELWWLDPEQVGHAANRPVPSKAYARTAIQHACVAWIVDVLHDATLRLRDKHGSLQALQPKHIAVLVNSNHEAQAMQAALGRAGVPASCNLHASVYTSGEAADLALLLDALAAPDDPQRARAARASLLAGDDANAIFSTLHDDARQAALLAGIATWAGSVDRHGPLPWLHQMIAQAAPHLLALPDGERRIANYLQLAELLQDLHTASFGVADLAARFARARVEAVDDADAARLRLDTDADAVTISTVHAAKGLEYDVVLVPYAVLGRDPDRKRDARPSLHWYHDDANAAHVSIGADAPPHIARRASDEIRAEEVRKFYVAVTRASALCVLPWGPVNLMQHSAAFHLLHVAGRKSALDGDMAGCDAALRELCARADGAARVVPLPSGAHTRKMPRTDSDARNRGGDNAPPLQARIFTRDDLQREWQVWSFSRLVRGSPNQASADPRPGAGDQDLAPQASPGPGGAAFGTAVHAVFEQTDFAAWRDAADIPTSEQPLIEDALRHQALGDNAGAVALTGACVRDALNATLPCGVRLCDVTPERRKAEIEFHLSLAPARTAELFALLHRHGYQRQRTGVAPEHLRGLLTGKIDLTFVHAGRFHLIDWKTNRCAPYDAAAMRAEIAAHDYDLQWLVYTLALHRWLGQQLPGYDYDTHVGDAYYLFVRGMHDGGGIHVDHPPRALVEALDALFDASGRSRP
jgi:exodeoxyribonuclease V beta subunit